MLEIALYQPDIPQNTATILRLGACLGVPVHVIEPTGFVWSDRALKRAGMDYLQHAEFRRHVSWDDFRDAMTGRRLVLATTKAAQGYTGFAFKAADIVLFGRESAGVPDEVHNLADARITIPMKPGLRSLNVAMSCAMITGEVLRQLGVSA